MLIAKIKGKIKNIYNALLLKKEVLKDKKTFDKNKIHFAATGLWPSINKTFFNQAFTRALIQAYDNKVKTKTNEKTIKENELFQFTTYKPDIEFFSVNCKRNAIDKSKTKIKIFYTGEDVHKNYTNYKDLLINKSDLSLGFDYPEDRNNATNYLRYPYWILCYFGYSENKDEIKQKVEWFNSQKNCRERFCSYVAFHDDDGLRKKMIDIVEKIGPVSCGGKSYHNDDSLANEYNDNKSEYISHFMFNICPENVSVKGYTTEKLFDAFAAGCIPIYYGSCGKAETFINKNAIVMYNGSNSKELEEKIRLLTNNEKYYNDFMKQERLFDSAIDCIYDMNHNLRIKYEEILEKKFRGNPLYS